MFDEVRRRYGFAVVSYVAMPDHIRLLISEPEKGDPSRVIQAIKQGFSRLVLMSLRKRRVAGQRESFPDPLLFMYETAGPSTPLLIPFGYEKLRSG